MLEQMSIEENWFDWINQDFTRNIHLPASKLWAHGVTFVIRQNQYRYTPLCEVGLTHRCTVTCRQKQVKQKENTVFNREFLKQQNVVLFKYTMYMYVTEQKEK